MIPLSFLVFILFVQDEIPFKAKEDFEVKFELSIKQRNPTDVTRNVVLNENMTERDKRMSSAQLPYLKLDVKILKAQPTEIKLKVFRDGGSAVFSKKIVEGMEFKLDLGFTDDIKDGISGYKHVMRFFSAEKKEVSKIIIEFDREGNYFVNGEKRGKI